MILANTASPLHLLTFSTSTKSVSSSPVLNPLPQNCLSSTPAKPKDALISVVLLAVIVGWTLQLRNVMIATWWMVMAVLLSA